VQTISSDAATIRDRAGRLNVLFINDTSRNGGPGRTLLDILKFLDPARFRRTVLIPRDNIVSRMLVDNNAADDLVFEPALIENLVEPFSRAIERRDFDAPLPLRVLRAAGNMMRAVAGFLRLLRRVRRDRYDLIFCNGTSANFVGGAVAAILGVPTIWHVFYPSVSRIVRPLHRRLAAGRHVGSIICVSGATAGQFDHCAAKRRIIHDALDIAEFDAAAAVPALRRELGLGAETVIFGAHGRILPRKGFVELIRAAEIVIDRLDAADRARCRFVVVGDTPQDMPSDHLGECRALVRELGLAEHVHFIGFRPDILSYIADFDVAIVPSIYPDPLPRAVLEAMALAKPVVAFAMGGIGEMVTDGVEGRLACGDPPDIEGLAAACLSCFADPEAWRRRGLAARSRVERDFDARRHARALEAEFLRVAGTS
jgi:glycosyltransferase involved in cell wall biosynthesis